MTSITGGLTSPAATIAPPATVHGASGGSHAAGDATSASDGSYDTLHAAPSGIGIVLGEWQPAIAGLAAAGTGIGLSKGFAMSRISLRAGYIGAIAAGVGAFLGARLLFSPAPSSVDQTAVKPLSEPAKMTPTAGSEGSRTGTRIGTVETSHDRADLVLGKQFGRVDGYDTESEAQRLAVTVAAGTDGTPGSIAVVRMRDRYHVYELREQGSPTTLLVHDDGGTFPSVTTAGGASGVAISEIIVGPDVLRPELDDPTKISFDDSVTPELLTPPEVTNSDGMRPSVAIRKTRGWGDPTLTISDHQGTASGYGSIEDALGQLNVLDGDGVVMKIADRFHVYTTDGDVAPGWLGAKRLAVGDERAVALKFDDALWTIAGDTWVTPTTESETEPS